ncbi:MAG: extracellular solute-binding protein [Sphingomonadales bacterium]|nr:extracellular solute-binding protein [Sphingomonadales bacterium]
MISFHGWARRQYAGRLASIVIGLAMLACSSMASAQQLTVNWYHKQRYLQPVIDAFTAETGIEVIVTNDYDRLNTDVIFVSDYKSLTETKNFNKFRKLDPEFFAEMSKVVPAQWRDRDGYWLGVVLRARTALVNKSMVPEAQRPKSLLELADPKWRGRMTIRSASNVYNRSLLAYMIYRYGEPAATRWAQGIVDNFGPEGRYLGDTPNARAVAEGKFAITFLNTYYLGYLQTQTGTHSPEMLRQLRDDVAVVWLDGGKFGLPVNVTGVGISADVPAGSERLDQAQKLVAFVLSPRGQALMSEHTFKYPVREDVAPSAYLQSFGTFRKDTFDLNELRYLYDDADRIMEKVGWKFGN